MKKIEIIHCALWLVYGPSYKILELNVMSVKEKGFKEDDLTFQYINTKWQLKNNYWKKGIEVKALPWCTSFLTKYCFDDLSGEVIASIYLKKFRNRREKIPRQWLYLLGDLSSRLLLNIYVNASFLDGSSSFLFFFGPRNLSSFGLPIQDRTDDRSC